MRNFQEVPEGDADFKLTPEEAKAWIGKIRANRQHAYLNDQATPAERDIAVAFVNRLYEVAAGQANTIKGYLDKHEAEKASQLRGVYGEADLTGGNRKSAFGSRAPENICNTVVEIGFGTKPAKSGFGKGISDIDNFPVEVVGPGEESRAFIERVRAFEK